MYMFHMSKIVRAPKKGHKAKMKWLDLWQPELLYLLVFLFSALLGRILSSPLTLDLMLLHYWSYEGPSMHWPITSIFWFFVDILSWGHARLKKVSWYQNLSKEITGISDHREENWAKIFQSWTWNITRLLKSSMSSETPKRYTPPRT